MPRSNEVDGRVWARDESGSMSLPVSGLKARSYDGGTRLERRSKVGNFFKGLGKDIKQGFQKAGTWLKSNWTTVVGVATKLIP
jgi:hypothetical protein